MGNKSYYVYSETDFEGPFDLDDDGIATIVDDAFGVYLLAERTDDQCVIVVYVGRGDLIDRLTSHAANGRGTYFFVKGLDSEAEAFREECRLFHKYGKRKHLDNRVHPAVPAHSRLKACSQRGCNGEAD